MSHLYNNKKREREKYGHKCLILVHEEMQRKRYW